VSTRAALSAALFLILVGDVLAWGVQTGWGRIEVTDVRWTLEDGRRMSGLLYVPEGATATDPAPGILAIHGYINSRETQDGFAIELSRRGYVVLALDQPGHGYSDPPSGSDDFGGPAGLAWLRSLDLVDTLNIGLEGHSMGGWAVLIAAARAPDDYRSIVIEGSSTGTAGAPDGRPGSPRNLAVVFSRYDEFSGFMWGSPVAADVPAGEKLMSTFGTSSPVEVGRMYGSIEAGTGQIFHQPPVTHPGDHLSRRAIGHAVDWFQATLDGGRELSSDDQIWYWKVFGNLLALIGMVLLIFPVGTLLLQAPVFADLARSPAPSRGATGLSWWVSAGAFTLLPAITLFPFKDLGGRFRPTALFPQSITNQLLAWAALTGAISITAFVVWHLATARKRASSMDDYGLTRDGRLSGAEIVRSFGLAVLVTLIAYATLVASAAVFTTDYRFWVFAIKPLSGGQFRAGLAILPVFTLFFGIYGTVLYGQLRRDVGRRTEMATVIALSTLGFATLIAVQYAPLFLGGTLWDPTESLWSIIAFQFLPLMSIVGAVTAFFHRKTGQIWVGAFLSGLLVSWIVAASQATHFAS